MTFQPYQEAEEEVLRRGREPLKAIKYAATLGAGTLGGSSLLNRVLPLLSAHIPEEIAKKGLAKVDPHLGKFIESASSLGHDFYEIRDFIRAKAAEEQEQEPQGKKGAQGGNVVKQYSPELHNFITQEMKKGRSPLEAGALASQKDNFKQVIKKIIKDHKTSFADLIEMIYGGTQPTSDMSREALTQQ